MVAPRHVCVVTGSRAEYGLLSGLLRALRDDDETELSVVVCGTHLVPEHGMTVDRIIDDGFEISGRVEMMLSSDSGVGAAKSVGLGVIGMADQLDRLAPDLAVVLGDRFEMLAVAQAALLLGIPLAHLHGGEVTEGAFDESIRHAITKLSQYHFTAADAFARRVVQLGEAPERVFNVGTLGLDNVAEGRYGTMEELRDALDGFSLEPGFVLVTFHPETLNLAAAADDAAAFVDALRPHLERGILVTCPNADPGGRVVKEAFLALQREHPDRVRVVASLGQRLYLAAVNHAGVVAGNSSSGLVEAPALDTPTVNVGGRQRGRPLAPSVLTCAPDTASIAAALERALAPATQARMAGQALPYGRGGGVATEITRIIKTLDLGPSALIKPFHDL